MRIPKRLMLSAGLLGSMLALGGCLGRDHHHDGWGRGYGWGHDWYRGDDGYRGGGYYGAQPHSPHANMTGHDVDLGQRWRR